MEASRLVGLSDWLHSEGLPAQLTRSAKQQEAATTGLMDDMLCRLQITCTRCYGNGSTVIS